GMCRRQPQLDVRREHRNLQLGSERTHEWVDMPLLSRNGSRLHDSGGGILRRPWHWQLRVPSLRRNRLGTGMPSGFRFLWGRWQTLLQQPVVLERYHLRRGYLSKLRSRESTVLRQWTPLYAGAQLRSEWDVRLRRARPNLLRVGLRMYCRHVHQRNVPA